MDRGRRSKRSTHVSVIQTKPASPLSILDVSEDEVADGSGMPLEEVLDHRKVHEEQRSELSRTKRKVISRGGHYIIRSSNGNSPWSSSSYDSQSTYSGPSQSSSYMSSRSREYGWNHRGRIGDSGLRTTTFGEVLPRKPDRRSLRKKLPRTFKGEIAQYAMLHGAAKAALHYEHRVGRRLRERVVRKFVQRYKERSKKKKKQTKP